jgi:hypothetical protein
MVNASLATIREIGRIVLIILQDLSVALNYGQGTGSPQMVRWVTEHTEVSAKCHGITACYFLLLDEADALLCDRLCTTHHTRTGVA